MKKISKPESRGFTIVELIVVIAIFTVITSISLFNQAKLNSTILVTNLAYEIALAVREAQTYGVGVRADAAGESFVGGYGVSFDMSRPSEIILFADIVGDQEVTDEAEELSHMTIQQQRGNTIKAICIGQPSNGIICSDASEHRLKTLNILFQRPNPEAVFFITDENDVDTKDAAAGPAFIVVNTPAGDNCRVVVVEKTGQIRVDNAESGFCENEID